jgi:RNA polymerase sigma-54 factor
MMRQGQSLVMTPQLLQAIKLLQFSNLELAAFLQEEIERNPLLEPQENDALSLHGGPESSEALADLPAPAASATSSAAPEAAGLSATSWTGVSGGGADADAPNLEAFVAARLTLRDHLLNQLAIAGAPAAQKLVAQAIIDAIDDHGYLREDLADIGARLGASAHSAAAALTLVQGFDPAGVGARDLAECLSIQLRERDRYDPAMQIFIAHLPLVARRDIAQLSRLCGVDGSDIVDMISEIRLLEPKPGRAFGDAPLQPVVADVVVRPAPDGSWLVELNNDALPRVLVNHSYATRVAATARGADKSFISGCLQNANWLTKSLEQRSRTILKVAAEIVRHQDAFLTSGVEHLRPLNLRAIADAIGMHESTVSRVTSNKYIMTPRGIFELKYFFSASIPTAVGGEAHSAESVRFRIKQMIDHEAPDAILSDDAIVARLKAANIDIARRTVAKYRDSLRIPSSVDRRRIKRLTAAGAGPGNIDLAARAF